MKLAIKNPIKVHSLLLAIMFFSGCSSIPTGPKALVLPGTGQSIEEFQNDEQVCREYATAQLGATASQSADKAHLKSAALGALVGAIAGVASGGSRGAGKGASFGVIGGTLSGAGAANRSSAGTQVRYDNLYIQCMYSKGHKVPVEASLMQHKEAPELPPPPPHHSD